MLRSAAEVLFHPSEPSSTGVSNNSPHAPNQQMNIFRNLRGLSFNSQYCGSATALDANSFHIPSEKTRQILLNFGMLFPTPPEYRLIPKNHLNGTLSGHPLGDGNDQS